MAARILSLKNYLSLFLDAIFRLDFQRNPINQSASSMEKDNDGGGSRQLQLFPLFAVSD